MSGLDGLGHPERMTAEGAANTLKYIADDHPCCAHALGEIVVWLEQSSTVTDWRRIAEDLETALVFVKCDLSEELMGRGITGEKWHSLIAAEQAIEAFNAAAEEEGRRCDVPAFLKTIK